MAIAMAQERNGFIYVYDEKNHQLFSLTGELCGYTAGTVTVKRNGFLYTYDEKGHQTSSRPC